MTVEYIVLGAILMAMGAVQTWLRHGPEGRKIQVEQQALQQRRMEQAKATAPDDFDPSAKAWKRSNRAWTGWTAILGGVGIAFGIVLIVLGILGY